MPISPARAAAFEILLRVERTDAYASELLHAPRFNTLSSIDHGLVTELVLGVLRWRGVLDECIAQHVTKTVNKLDPEVLTALRLGVYQLLFLDRVPTHSAVNESVELVKQARKRSASGMVNAVLRKISGAATHPASQKTRDKGGATASQLPHTPVKSAGEIGHPLRVEAASPLSAHPAWLVERWTKTYGRGPAEGICSYDQSAPQTTIRITEPGLIDELSRDGIALTPGNLLSKAFVVADGDITKTRASRERRLIIQDEASQLVALLVGSGNLLLDCCAAPGGKARILAEQNPQSIVIGMELHPHRAALLKKLAHSENIRVIAADARSIPLAPQFDRVLVDAPCSGTGTLARNPEIKWRLKPEDITRLQAYQLEILLSAMDRVANGGRLIYSTCSLEPEENSEVVQNALRTNSAFRVLECRDELAKLKHQGELAVENLDSLLNGPHLRTVPGIHACDGFFAVILEKS